MLFFVVGFFVVVVYSCLFLLGFFFSRIMNLFSLAQFQNYFEKKSIYNRAWYWRRLARGDPTYFWAYKYIIDRIKQLVFGAVEPRSGAVGSALEALNHPSLNHRVDVVSGILEPDCREAIQGFFDTRRRKS